MTCFGHFGLFARIVWDSFSFSLRIDRNQISHSPHWKRAHSSSLPTRAMGLCCFSPLAHLLHAAWPVSERGFNHIPMRTLGLPIEAPVSVWGLNYITMRALGLPIEAPFSDFARIGILMREQSVNRDECQCANGECQCANGDHRLRKSFLENRKFAYYDTGKERHSDKWPVNFGVRRFWLTVREKIITMRGKTSTMRAR